MNEDYVSYELAVALKEAGFDWQCRAVWHFDGEDYKFIEDYGATFQHPSDIPHWNTSVVWGLHFYSAPTLAQAAKWLRDVKGIAINVMAHDGGGYHTERVILPNCTIPESREWYAGTVTPMADSYEEALSDGIELVLELIEKVK